MPTRPVRLRPISEEELSSEEQTALDDLAEEPTANIYRTVVRNPEAAEAMVNLGRALRAGDLPTRHREILILRTGCNCQSAYELAQHYQLAVHIGMTDADMERIRAGPDAPGWDPFEAVLCRAADELHATNTVTDETWNALAARYDDRQLIHTTMLVGYYHLVSFVLNALGVPLDREATPFPGS